MATAAEVQTAYKAINRVDLNTSSAQAIADSINNGSTTLDLFIAGQLESVAATTQAAVAIAAFVTGVTPTSEKLDQLAEMAKGQYESYKAMGVGIPELGAYEAFGKDFSATAEFEAKYGALEGADFINTVYAGVFGKLPTAAQLASLQGQIDYFTGLYTEAGLENAEAMAKGAVLGQIVGYAMVTDASADSKLDEQVAKTLTAAANGDETVYDAPLPAPSPNTGDTFTLTTAVDTLVGTDANDTFQGIGGGFFGATLNTFDSIDGGAGTDTLNLIIRGGTLASDFAVKNVEVINLQQDAATLGSVDASAFGAEAQQIWQIGGAANVTDLADSQTAGFRGVDLSGGVSVTGAGESVAVVLDKVTGLAVDLSVAGDDVTSVSLSGTSTATAAQTVVLSLNALPAELETVNLALSFNANIGVHTDGLAGLKSATTINAADTTGKLTLELGNVSGDTFTALTGMNLESLTAGSGNDLVRAAQTQFAADAVDVKLGAGADRLEMFAGAGASADATTVTVTGGAGADTFAISGGNIAASDSKKVGFENLITITDFGTGNDTLSLENFDGYTTASAVESAVEGAATLYEAVAAVQTLLADNATLTGYTNTASFKFGSNTYVYQDSGILDGDDAATLTGDLLIELTGDVGLSLVGNTTEFQPLDNGLLI